MHNGRPVSTGIFKTPVDGPIAVHTHGLAGDVQADLSVHGGPEKAVYAYPWEHYAAWSAELGRGDFSPGQFGENLTIEGLGESTVHIGDVFRIGSAELQVSQPRAPCLKLGIKMKSAAFPAAFLKSGRVGFYLRVLCEGRIAAGDAVACVSTDDARMTVVEMSHLRHFDHGNLDGARRAAALTSLSADWRGHFQKRVAGQSP